MNSSAPTVCLCIRTLLKGGAEKQTLMLARVLRQRYNVFCVVFYGEAIDESNRQYADKHGIRLIKLTGPVPLRFFKLHRLLRKHRVRCLITYLALCNVAGSILGRLAGVRTIVNGSRSSRFEARKLILQKWIHNRIASHTVCNNHTGHDVLSKSGFRTDRLSVIPNCLEMPENFTERETTERLTLLTVARFTEAKDYPTSFRAFNLLRERHPELSPRFVIVGYGELESTLRQQIKQLGLDKLVELVINPPDVERYYREADIYLSTSVFEGLSNSIMEALGHSLPVVATRVGDNARLVTEGESGFLCAPGDAEGIADALEMLAVSHPMRMSFGKRGWQDMRATYGEQVFLQRYVDLLTGLGCK